MNKAAIAVTALLLTLGAHANDAPPGVISKFCAQKLGGDIAGVSQPFNATDVVEKGKPTRRMLGYFVTSTTSYLWYEHGGRGYHQHLVRFNSARPEEVKASYAFIGTNHKKIENLIKDTEFLRNHIANGGEL